MRNKRKIIPFIEYAFIDNAYRKSKENYKLYQHDNINDIYGFH